MHYPRRRRTIPPTRIQVVPSSLTTYPSANTRGTTGVVRTDRKKRRVVSRNSGCVRYITITVIAAQMRSSLDTRSRTRWHAPYVSTLYACVTLVVFGFEGKAGKMQRGNANFRVDLFTGHC